MLIEIEAFKDLVSILIKKDTYLVRLISIGL